jgi:hypothetical protein
MNANAVHRDFKSTNLERKPSSINQYGINKFKIFPNPTINSTFTLEILDFDDNNPKLPVGLSFNLSTKSNQSYTLPLLGTLNMVLSHYDGVPKSTSKSDESDIDINFPIRLK